MSDLPDVGTSRGENTKPVAYPDFVIVFRMKTLQFRQSASGAFLARKHLQQKYLTDRKGVPIKEARHMNGDKQTRSRRKFALVITILLTLPTAAFLPGTCLATDNERVEVTFLVNEGVLLKAGGTSLLIDAFVEPRKSTYNPLPEAVLKDMLEGRPPFATVQLVLVSHSHHDHFDPDRIGSFLSRHPETILASSTEVLQDLRARHPGAEWAASRLKEIKASRHQITSHNLNGVRVDFVNMNHEGSAFYPDPVLGHIIHMGGKRILHLSDSEVQTGNLETLSRANLNIDIAILPFWVLKSEEASVMVREKIAAKKWVAIHLPTRGLEEIKTTISKRFPEVIFLSRAMESHRFK
jgi:L-ascorbate metabolism protein UlaG (beta-lactamase superfamily)